MRYDFYDAITAQDIIKSLREFYIYHTSKKFHKVVKNNQYLPPGLLQWPVPQEYFYNLKLKNPKRYERLNFSEKTKAKESFSKDLSTILAHLRFCGFLDLDNNILFE